MSSLPPIRLPHYDPSRTGDASEDLRRLEDWVNGPLLRAFNLLVADAGIGTSQEQAAAEVSDGDGGGGGGSNVEPGTIDGQLLRWDDTDQLWEPADNVTLDADGDLTLEAELLAISQSNATPFVFREVSGQTQPVLALQVDDGAGGGVSTILFTPSSGLLDLIRAVTGGAQIRIEGYAGTPQVVLRRSQGTRTSPTATSSGSQMGEVAAVGYTGSVWETSHVASMEFQATETHGASAWGARVAVKTTPNGSATAAEALGVEGNGDITVAAKTLTEALGVDNFQAASALGALVGVSEVYNKSGTSLGYAAIYDGFTP